MEKIARLILVPAGISFLDSRKYKDESIIQKLDRIRQNPNKEDCYAELMKDKEFIDKVIAEQSNLFQRADLRNLSVELASLKLLSEKIGGFGKQDQICLMGTDTPEGKLSLKLSEEAIKKNFPTCGPPCAETIPDFGKAGEEEFFNGIFHGVKFVLSRYREYNERRKKDKTPFEGYLNVTSGFKAVQPILSLVSFALRFNIFYLFEETGKLIVIPSIATVTFDMIPPPDDKLAAPFAQVLEFQKLMVQEEALKWEK